MSTLQSYAQKNNLTLATAQFALLKQSNQVAQVYLVNGIRLQSVVVEHSEKFLLLLDRSGEVNLVNRKAISTSSSTGRIDEAVDIDLGGKSLEDFAFKKLSKSLVNVFLFNGVRLTGNIQAIDSTSVYMESNNNGQIIQLDSIASISKSDEVQNRN